jgi:hypothetical protein
VRLFLAATLFSVPLTLGSCKRSNQPPSTSPQPASTSTPSSTGDRSEIQTVENLLPTLPDRGAAMFFLASHYARLGDSTKALARLKECISLHEGVDPTNDPAFKSLRSSPQFEQLLQQIQHDYPPVHRARIVFTVQQADLFPEGLAADPTTRVFYLGSMHRKKILKISASGEASDFVPPDLYDLMPVGGLKVEPTDHSIWAATDPGVRNRSELVHFDKNGKLLERYPILAPGSHDLNDLVIRNAREIYTTDTFGHHVYRFDRQLHTFTPLTFSRPIFYPNGITLSGDNNLLYVGDDLGVLILDLRDNSAREVNPGEGNTLSGIDGLYWYKNSLLFVQYGTSAYRVARARLSPDGFRVISLEIFERGTPLVSDPTTAAILGSNFYFIANTGIYNLKDDTIIDPAKLEPIHIAIVPLL